MVTKKSLKKKWGFDLTAFKSDQDFKKLLRKFKLNKLSLIHI